MKRVLLLGRIRNRKAAVHPIILAFFCILACLQAKLAAGPADAGQAQRVVEGWLNIHPRPLGAELGRSVGRVETFYDGSDNAIYHVVYLEPSGYVIVPADDGVEPILCFVERGGYRGTAEWPLGALVGQDVPARIAAARAVEAEAMVQTQTSDNNALKQVVGDARAKWDRLLSADSSVMMMMGRPGVADLRAGPLLASTWGQTTVGDYIGGISCYNYYTPPYEPGDPDNYPIGCVANAMAQLMRYHQHPTSYNWADMPLQPDPSITLAQRRTIGWLCYRAAESTGTKFAPTKSGGSSASLDVAYLRLRDTFGYGNSVIARNPPAGTVLNNMVNPNLDAGLPVLLGFEGTEGGHAVVCDGYGYNASTLYHHLNMGLSGRENAWYALPVVDSSYYYYLIHTCVYNIYPSGSGEIISGRVADIAGNPIPGAVIQATPAGSTSRYATTDENGIYALPNLPSNRSIALGVSKSGYTFPARTVQTGTSNDYGSTGNLWGVDFVATGSAPPVAHDQSISVIAGEATPIALVGTDDGLPNPPGRLSYKITRLPSHGSLSDPFGGEVTAVPYTLANGGNVITYRGCSYYSGPDEFLFVVDDGGAPPTGGESAPARVGIDVNDVFYTTFGADSPYIAPWPLMTSYDDSRTQVIYLSSEIGGPKRITGLAIDVYERPGYELNHWTIRLKHTARDGFYGPPFFETAGWTTVYLKNEPRPTTGWYEFDFQTPFEYNGIDNLMVDFSHDNRSNSYDGFCTVWETGVPRVVLNFSDSWHGAPTDWSDDTFFPYWPYGATAVPSIRLKSTTGGQPLPGDIVQNCSVDMADLVALCDAWLSTPADADWSAACDISEPPDEVINELDFAVLGENWGRTTE